MSPFASSKYILPLQKSSHFRFSLYKAFSTVKSPVTRQFKSPPCVQFQLYFLLQKQVFPTKSFKTTKPHHSPRTNATGGTATTEYQFSALPGLWQEVHVVQAEEMIVLLPWGQVIKLLRSYIVAGRNTKTTLLPVWRTTEHRIATRNTKTKVTSKNVRAMKARWNLFSGCVAVAWIVIAKATTVITGRSLWIAVIRGIWKWLNKSFVFGVMETMVIQWNVRMGI